MGERWTARRSESLKSVLVPLVLLVGLPFACCCCVGTGLVPFWMLLVAWPLVPPLISCGAIVILEIWLPVLDSFDIVCLPLLT